MLQSNERIKVIDKQLRKKLSLWRAARVEFTAALVTSVKSKRITPSASGTEAFCSIIAVMFSDIFFIYATMSSLCIISPVALLLLGVLGELGRISASEDAAGGLGMIILLVLVAAACAIFISCGARTKAYEFLEKEQIDTEYGVTGMVKARKQQYEATYTKYNILGTVTCILGVVPMFLAAMASDDDLVGVAMVCLLLIIEAVGVSFFIIAGINNASFDKLLQEGDYSIKEKNRSPIVSVVTTVYWLVVTAVFLLIGFINNGWRHAGIIWPVAGVLYGAVFAVTKLFDRE